MAQNRPFKVDSTNPKALEFARILYLKRCILPAIEVLTPMQGKTRERWVELCEQAAREEDPNRLMQLVQEINKLLIEKEELLAVQRAAKHTTA